MDRGSHLQVLAGALLALLEEGGAQWSSSVGLGDSVLQGVLDRLQVAGLRPYQAEAVRVALTAPMGRSILELGTAAGKTWIVLALSVVRGGRVLYLVQNQELARQTAAKAKTAIPRMAQAAGLREPVLLCRSYGTARDRDMEVGSVLVDECHGLAAKNRARVLQRVQEAGTCKLWTGLSATPLGRQSHDNALVVGLLGPVRFKYQIGDLARDGYTSPVAVNIVRYNHESDAIEDN